MLPRVLVLRTLRQHAIHRRAASTLIRPRPLFPSHTRAASHVSPQNIRFISSHTPADLKVEEIAELYATAQDEFEIAMEETEKMSVYAEEDRKAAREELTKLQQAYKAVIEGPDEKTAMEVKQRVGQRIRELEQGIAAMEELAQNQD